MEEISMQRGPENDTLSWLFSILNDEQVRNIATYRLHST